MTRPFSVAMPRFTGDMAAWRDDVRRIEGLGFDSVTISDHFTQGWVMEPVVAMSVALEITSRLRVQTLVLGNDYRHPVLLAKAMATLDVLSGGRVDLGLGAGWMPSDYRSAGMPLASAKVRIGRLEESVQVLRGRFGPDPVSFEGTHYRIEELDGLPKPIQPGGPPILVGGDGKQVLSLAGRHADTVGINARMSSVVPTGRSVEDLTRDSVGEKRRWAREAAASVGRDPDALDFQFSVLSLRLDDVPEARDWTSSLAREADPALDSPSLVHGPVGACAEQPYADREALGLNHVHLGGDPVAAAALMAAVG